ncbi:MAG: YbhB/YbcL family Raf kinase inhibitor-like protein [Thermoprotei archaeon]
MCADFRLWSDFEGRFPSKYTCEGENQSPQLQWSGAPECESYALIVEDTHAPSGTFIHWTLYNIPAKVDRLPPNLPKTAELHGFGTQGVNDFGNMGYDGPCPPRGHGEHRYYFRLYALRTRTEYPPGLTAEKLKERIRGLVVSQAEFVGKYSRK